jgi:TRAP transporter TAXI family solute receptor
MLGAKLWRVFRSLVTLAGTIGAVSLVLIYFFPDPPSRITIATAFKGASFDYYGRRYKERLERAGLKVDLRETAGAVDNVTLLRDPTSGVQIAFVTGGVSDGNRAPELYSLGLIYNQPFWIFYTSAEPIQHLSQLKGKRIAVGPTGSGTRFSAETIFFKSGINPENTTFLPYAGNEAVDALNDGKVDVVWIIGAPRASAVQALLTNPTVRLLSFPMADALTRMLPELVKLVLPQGVFDIDRVIPPNDISLLGTTTRILIRKDLHPEIVHLFLKAMGEEHSGQDIFQKVGEFPMGLDPEYPMAPNAIEYYRNGPSLLQRHLPLWLMVHMQRAIALLVTIVAVGVPIFTYLPRVYRWLVHSRILKIYRRLRDIEDELNSDMTRAQVIFLQAELERVERSTNILRIPMRFSEIFFSLKMHINLIRTRLATRRLEVQDQITTAG